MRILFAIGNGYPPEFSGGVQSSTDHLVRRSIAAGHDAAVLAALFGDGIFGLAARAKLKLGGSNVARDAFPGYPVYRAWFPAENARSVVEAFRPDVAVVQCQQSVPIGRELQAAACRWCFISGTSSSTSWKATRPSSTRGSSPIPASPPSATGEAFGLDCTVIPPTIEPGNYRARTAGKRGDHVTLINVYPEKGFARAVEVARACPDIPFLFLEGWKLDDEHLARVRAELDPLSNVTFERRTSDMRAVYARTRILFAPSKWEEAWGRVASEAHCSGIPVVGSSRGGLPEAIGPGGIVLDYEAPVDEWANAVRSLWSDRGRYEELSAKAWNWSNRSELDPDRQFATFMDVLEGARAGHRDVAHAVAV